MERSFGPTMAAVLLAMTSLTSVSSAAAERKATPSPMVFNGSFEDGLEGWKLLVDHAAKASCESDSGFAQDGKRSVYLRKENSLGDVSLVTERSIPVTPGESYRLRAYYKADNVNYPMSFLLLRAEQDGDFSYDPGLDHGWGLQCQSVMLNTEPGKWDKRLYDFKARQNVKEVKIRLVLIGAPAGVWIDNVTMEKVKDADEAWNKSQVNLPSPPREGLITEAALMEKLKNSPECSAQLARVDGAATLLINGKPEAPVIHKPNPAYPEISYGKGLYDNGVKIHLAPVNLGSYSGMRPLPDLRNFQSAWLDDEVYDFSKADASLREAFVGAPDAYFIVEICFGSPKGWTERHLGECWQNKAGQRAYASQGVFNGGFADKLPDKKSSWYFSYYSKLWQAQLSKGLERWCAHLKNSPYGKRVVGFMLSGGYDGQLALPCPDFSAPAQAAFRDWLRSKYGTDENLAAAWNSPKLTFAQAGIMDFSEKTPDMYGDDLFLFDPVKDRKKIDFHTFFFQSTQDILDGFAKVLKEGMGKPVVCFRYFFGQFTYGPASTKGYPFLESKYLDACAPQPFYALRRNGVSLQMMQPHESYHLNDKLLIMEFDQRTWKRTCGNSEFGAALYVSANSVDEYSQIQKKLMGEMFARGQGFWFYDMNGGWFSDPGIYQEIRKAMAASQHAYDGKRNFKADVAVCAHDKTEYLLPNVDGFDHAAMRANTGSLGELGRINLSGVPYDFYYFEDLKRNALTDYKVYVFLSNWYMDESDRAFIEKLKADGKTLVWLVAPGYASEDGLSTRRMEEVTGMGIHLDKKAHAGAAVMAEKTTHPLGKGLLELQSWFSLMRMQWSADQVPPGYCDTLRFYADDPQGAVLARFEDDKRPAVVVKDFKAWRSVFVSEPAGLSSELLHNIAEGAGAYVLTEPGIAMEMNNNFMEVHGTRSGEYSFKLREPRTIKDLWDNGKVIAVDTKEFKYRIEAGRSYWFGLY